MPCPRCRQDAPIVYRGVFAYCAACNAPRLPLSAPAVNLAGQPSKVGGRVAGVIGWTILGGGLLIATAIILFLQLLFPAANLGFAVGLPLALIATVIGLLVLFGSRRLRTSGTDAERRTRAEALFALATHRGGAVTVQDAARSLDVSQAEAAELLSHLSETDPERVTLEVDDDGNLFYLFRSGDPSALPPGARYRVDARGRVRVVDPYAGGAEAPHAHDHADDDPKTSSTRRKRLR